MVEDTTMRKHPVNFFFQDTGRSFEDDARRLRTYLDDNAIRTSVDRTNVGTDYKWNVWGGAVFNLYEAEEGSEGHNLLRASYFDHQEPEASIGLDRLVECTDLAKKTGTEAVRVVMDPNRTLRL